MCQSKVRFRRTLRECRHTCSDGITCVKCAC